jgi:hypothetical protein
VVGELVTRELRDPPTGKQFVAPHNRPMRGHGYETPPGPGRHWSRRHFASQDLIGWWLLTLIVIVPSLVMCSRV